MSSIIGFLALTFAFTWALLPAASTSISVSLVALCGPAVSACMVAALAGNVAWRDLCERIAHWRVPGRWYVVVLLAPVLISGVARSIEQFLGAPGTVHMMPITPLQFAVFVLVAGEEIGWRGFLLPRLLPRVGSWPASVIVGVVWAVWHLPLFSMASMPQYGSPFPAFVVYTTALSVLLTRLSELTRGSVILATLFHGAVNTFGFANDAASSFQRGWANAIAYGCVAVAVGTVAWRKTGASDRWR